jgi:hypothetical protein
MPQLVVQLFRLTHRFVFFLVILQVHVVRRISIVQGLLAYDEHARLASRTYLDAFVFCKSNICTFVFIATDPSTLELDQMYP